MKLKLQVFLSYGSEDDSTPSTGEDRLGWVTYFEKFLRYELNVAGRWDIDIWRDNSDLKRWRQLDEGIDDGLASSGIFVGIVSPVYVKKEWCKKEVEQFAALFGSDARMFKVEKRPVEKEDVPEPLGSRPPVRMYHRLPHDEPPYREFYHPGRKERDDRFIDAIQSLVRWIIEAFGDGGKGSQGPDRPPPSESPTLADSAQGQKEYVYVADYLGNFHDFTRKVEGELEALHLAIADAPANASHVSVHLFGGGLDQNAVERFRKGLDDAGKARLTRIIWAPRDAVRTGKAADLLDELRSGMLEAGDEFVEGGFDQFKGVLQDTLEDRAKGPGSNIDPDISALIAGLSAEEREKLRHQLSDGVS